MTEATSYNLNQETMSHNPNQEPITPEFVAQLVETAQIVLPEDGVYNKLKSAEEEGRQLRVKMGFDPTSPDLHLGHAVSMHMLRRFQEMGHLPVIIIGDFTARIGDPSGRSAARPLATPEQIDENAKTYIEQLGKVLDISKIEVRRNSEWLESMNAGDVIRLLAQGTLSQVITRDDFRKRLDAGTPIGLHEIVYPYFQGSDSLAIDADIEIGGVDQLYAFQAARTLQSNKEIDPEALIMMPLLRGTDGTKKMGKSLGNYIGLTDEPRDMFGKVMSIPDTLIEEYLKLASTFTRDDIAAMLEDIAQGRNPMEVKAALARNITTTYHSADAADDAQSYFERQFRRRREDDMEYKVVTIGRGVTSLVEILVQAGAAASNNKARRLISDGAVRINGVKATPETSEGLTETDGLRIKAGKRTFIQTKLAEEE